MTVEQLKLTDLVFYTLCELHMPVASASYFAPDADQLLNEVATRADQIKID